MDLKTVSNLSTCHKRKVGAILYDENNKPISYGYNMVICHSKPCCKRIRCNSGDCLEKCNAIHAEMLAVSNRNIKGKKLLVNVFPCPVCSKYLAVCNLGELYYYEDYPGINESLALFKEFGVKVYKVKQDGIYEEAKEIKEENARKFFE